MKDDDGQTVRRKGYRFMLARLFRARQICGVDAVMALLKGHGATSARDVKPELYEQIAIFAESMVLNVNCWEDMLALKWKRGSPAYRKSIDAWLDACEIEVRFTYPNLYNERGKPIHTKHCQNG